ncbi:uncharacterized protein MYCFIDRAFT_177305 [Pseudocercospora fijiensis CIRAD86]|uniref:Uncharacterized protein n=1 Tax=Pseudocercospora fijiensis (strain CIRAD86) TaxID=383855 RepID=M3A6X0_PSEFD|nr:uncharacterized protein MYCFIDRAFT_177305 [Pseudocercospora fijiensis CIRAD86]EME80356.1 hypothetical protein MYCFIDRAFT_177305 [Pseudocercospora fijiensis CIRAD86]
MDETRPRYETLSGYDLPCPALGLPTQLTARNIQGSVTHFTPADRGAAGSRLAKLRKFKKMNLELLLNLMDLIGNLMNQFSNRVAYALRYAA